MQQKTFVVNGGKRVNAGVNLALANLLNASSFLQKASRNRHQLLFLAS